MSARRIPQALYITNPFSRSSAITTSGSSTGGTGTGGGSGGSGSGGGTGGGIPIISYIVDFVDTSSPTPTEWFWEFRTNTNVLLGSSTQRNPSFTFPSAGTYTVRLRTNNDANFRVKTVTVT